MVKIYYYNIIKINEDWMLGLPNPHESFNFNIFLFKIPKNIYEK